MEKKEILTKKVLTAVELERILAYWNFKGNSVVALYGTFDIFHPSVFDLITFAAEQGNELIVGIKPDEEVKKERGEGKPVFSHEQRAAMVAHHQLVSAVYICEQGLQDFLQKVKPAVAVCSSNASDSDRKGVETVGAWNGKAMIFKSSSTIINDIISKYK